MDVVGVEIAGRIPGQVRVIELIACVVADPEPPAAQLLPADPIDRPACDRNYRRAERREDVVAVMPISGDVASERTVGVAVLGPACDWEDVLAVGERGCDFERPPARCSGPAALRPGGQLIA